MLSSDETDTLITPPSRVPTMCCFAGGLSAPLQGTPRGRHTSAAPPAVAPALPGTQALGWDLLVAGRLLVARCARHQQQLVRIANYAEKETRQILPDFPSSLISARIRMLLCVAKAGSAAVYGESSANPDKQKCAAEKWPDQARNVHSFICAIKTSGWR